MRNPNAVKFQPVPLQTETQSGGYLFLQGLNFGVDKFDHLPGGQVDQMVMMLAGAVFIAGAAIAELQPLEDAAFFKKLHRPVDRRQRDPGIECHGAAMQLFDIRVVFRRLQDLRDQTTRSGHTHAARLAAGDKIFCHDAAPGSERLSAHSAGSAARKPVNCKDLASLRQSGIRVLDLCAGRRQPEREPNIRRRALMPLTARELLDRLVAFPTVSRDSNLPLIDWVQDYLAGEGISATRLMSPCGTKAHLYASVGPEVEGGVMLSGHTDVVPVDGQAWTTDPWTVTEKDGRLYGRGCCDMKGFDALALAALVKGKSLPLKRPIQIALSYDEEVGCIAAADLAREASVNLPKAAAVVVGEPSMMKVVTAHKGGLGINVHVHGFEVHSSLQPYGVSAIHEAAKLIQWCTEQNDLNAAKPVNPLAEGFDPHFTTLHVGMIEGGTAHNITAKDCIFKIGVRAVPGEDQNEWRDKVYAEAERISEGMRKIHPEAYIECSTQFLVPALAPEVNGAAEELTRRLTGDNAKNVVSYGTEGGQFQVAGGYSTVVCGPGDIAQAHQPDEWISLEQFAAGEAFMDRLLAELQK